MDAIRIVGRRRLSGSIPVSGAKNAILPALTASLLTDQEVRLRNVPNVRDVDTMIKVLEHLGADCSRDGDSATVRLKKLLDAEAPYDLVRTMRASVLTLGPLVARHGRARVSRPGGCAIGARPIDLHLDVLRAMGAEVSQDHGYIEARADRLRGTRYTFDRVTVTGTENAMMAASLARGDTLLRNCAQEPEVCDLAELLTRMGAQISGAGTDTIRVEGVDSLKGADHRVVPDRIEAGTFLCAAALCGDHVVVEGCRPEHLSSLIQRMQTCGVRMEVGADAIAVEGGGELTAADISTRPYPGFATDLQAQYMVLMTQAKGASVITETIFENRFMHVQELQRLGARIRTDGHNAFVEGPRMLSGAQVMATDLRASASLILAGLVAQGETLVRRVYHLDRGYDRLEEKLRGLGAEIERVKE
jgi:UDP-N-acetylglucosamine 1-carboxyvinyltransferase